MTEKEFIDVLSGLNVNSEIKDQTFSSPVIITSNIEGKYISVKDSIFEKGLFIKHCTIAHSLYFSGCIFEGGLHSFYTNYLGGAKISFHNCTFRGFVEFENTNIENIEIRRCSFENTLAFTDITGNNTTIQISDSKIRCNNYRINEFLVFSSCDAKEIRIERLDYQKEMIFESCGNSDVFIGDGNYSQIRFGKYNNLKSLTIQGTTASRENLNIKKIVAPTFDITGNILIQNAKIGEFYFNELKQNEGSFKIQNVSFWEEFALKNSDLGRVLFNEVNFRNATVLFDNSYLGNCVFSNIEWQEKHRLYNEKDTVDENGRSNIPIKERRIRREVYRQLKNVMKAQSSNIDALEFYRNEMREYWFEIRLDPQVSLWEKFIVATSKWSSDFGVSLKRPLRLLLIFHSFFFCLLILCHYDKLHFDFSYFNHKEVLKGLGHFLLLLNPVHKLPDNQDGIIITIDFLIRIFSGFFIYHIIRATRKYARL